MHGTINRHGHIFYQLLFLERQDRVSQSFRVLRPLSGLITLLAGCHIYADVRKSILVCRHTGIGMYPGTVRTMDEFECKKATYRAKNSIEKDDPGCEAKFSEYVMGLPPPVAATSGDEQDDQLLDPTDSNGEIAAEYRGKPLLIYVNEPDPFEEPNCYFGIEPGTSAIGLYAWHDVDAGKEITADYGRWYKRVGYKRTWGKKKEWAGEDGEGAAGSSTDGDVDGVGDDDGGGDGDDDDVDDAVLDDVDDTEEGREQAWKCPTCTCLNDSSFPACSVCFALRKNAETRMHTHGMSDAGPVYQALKARFDRGDSSF